MFFKLALSNVRKSIKDFTVYFLTLTFGVCLFYVFNSIESQKSMMVLSESQKEILVMLTKMINGVSVFVSVILGFLIIYANKFLIKRRKKELAIYMTLGMEKGKISKILILETFVISIFSLGIGLLIGVFASQGLSVITAKLFEVDLSNFHFVFSFDAFIKSIIYFGIIFIIVMIFNVIIVSKYKLIKLLNANKLNEKLKLKNLYVSVFLFLVSIASLAFAYRCIIHNGMADLNREFWMAIIFGTIGTLLFFMSLSGFLLKVIQANKKIYFKGLNMFILRQINNKINTTFISMTLICLMLLVTIGTLSSGMSLSSAMVKDTEKAAPFDASYTWLSGERGVSTELNYSVKEKFGDKLSESASDYTEVNYYDTNVTFDKLMDNFNNVLLNENTIKNIKQNHFKVISLSDYNKVLKMKGEKSFSLKDNQFAVICNNNQVKDFYNVKRKIDIDFNGKKYSLGYNKLLDTQLTTYFSLDVAGVLVLPDSAVNGLNVAEKTLNVNFKNKDMKATDLLQQLSMEQKLGTVTDGESSSVIVKGNTMVISKTEIIENSVGAKVMISYLAIYIGFVFLITAAAVLALQQLSESSDNIERYKLLREIGTDEKMINKALFTQVFIYFMMPLGLAVIHSIVGISVVNNIVKMVGNLDILSNTILTAAIFLVIYGGYFLATYLSCKNMIKEKK